MYKWITTYLAEHTIDVVLTYEACVRHGGFGERNLAYRLGGWPLAGAAKTAAIIGVILTAFRFKRADPSGRISAIWLIVNNILMGLVCLWNLIVYWLFK